MPKKFVEAEKVHSGQTEAQSWMRQTKFSLLRGKSAVFKVFCQMLEHRKMEHFGEERSEKRRAKGRIRTCKNEIIQKRRQLKETDP